MAGFPLRFIRSFLGPKFRNTRPVKDPNTQMGAEKFNPLFWQLSGLNLVVSRVYLEAAWTGAAFQMAHQREAWNAENDQSHPTLARASAGVYSYTFAATYLDEDGTAVQTVLGAPHAWSPQVLAAYADRVDAYAWVDPGNALVVHVRLFDAAGAGIDAPFALSVY